MTESVEYLRQLDSDLRRYRQCMKLFKQTQEYTSLCDSVLESVDCRIQPISVLSRNRVIVRAAKAAVKLSKTIIKKIDKTDCPLAKPEAIPLG